MSQSILHRSLGGYSAKERFPYEREGHRVHLGSALIFVFWHGAIPVLGTIDHLEFTLARHLSQEAVPIQTRSTILSQQWLLPHKGD